MKRAIAAILAVVFLSSCAYTNAQVGSSTYVGDKECEKRLEKKRNTLNAFNYEDFPLDVMWFPFAVLYGLVPVNCDRDLDNAQPRAAEAFSSETK